MNLTTATAIDVRAVALDLVACLDRLIDEAELDPRAEHDLDAAWRHTVAATLALPSPPSSTK